MKLYITCSGDSFDSDNIIAAGYISDEEGLVETESSCPWWFKGLASHEANSGNYDSITNDITFTLALGEKLCVLQGTIYNIDDIAKNMDPAIREALHNELAPCSAQEFIEAYIKQDIDFIP